ncbi:hypothetical protein BJ742DRAFT_819016 [Cladochytrium replicatum]|nr:hypothetical protein BJ742DRAFT_819016 [Cladochytrium replicatum]
MGRKGIAKRAKGGATSATVAIDPTFPVESYIAHAQDAIDKGQLSVARKFLLRSSSLYPDSVETLELLGAVEMEVMNANDPELLFASHAEQGGNMSDGMMEDSLEEAAGQTVERAKQYFMMSVELRPDRGYAKYLYLGQLSEGKDAIGWYQRGVEILQTEWKEAAKESEKAMLARKISSALCSMTEIYMTDCCDEPEAEASCESYMTQAFDVDPFSPEVYQTYASVKISQCQTDGARSALLRSLEFWYPAVVDASANGTPPGEMPPYPGRIALAKLLIETALYRKAIDVLDICRLENDEDPDGWYVSGWANYRMAVDGKGMPEDAEMTDAERLELVKDARDCFHTLIQLQEKYDSVEPEMMSHAQELLKEMHEQYLSKFPMDDENGNDAGGDEGDWVDMDSDYY